MQTHKQQRRVLRVFFRYVVLGIIYSIEVTQRNYVYVYTVYDYDVCVWLCVCQSCLVKNKLRGPYMLLLQYTIMGNEEMSPLCGGGVDATMHLLYRKK